MADIKISDVIIKTGRREVNTESVKTLSESIKEIGLQNPIVINKDNELISGLHRLEAYKLLGKDSIPCTIVEFKDTLHYELAEIDENLMRNDLNDAERIKQKKIRKEIWEQIYPETTKENKVRACGGNKGNQHTVSKSASSEIISEPPDNLTQSETQKSFIQNTAQITGLSERTERQEIQIGKNLDDEVLDNIISDKVLSDKIGRSKVQLLELSRQPVEKQKVIVEHIASGKVKDVREAIKEEKKIEKSREAENYKDVEINIDFRLGDFEKILDDIPDNSIDLILTDPPYPLEFIDCWSKLAIFAKKKLKPNAFCITYSGQLNMINVLNRMKEHLDYYWMFSLLHTGNKQLIYPRNIFCNWKPIFIFQKGFKKHSEMMDDKIDGTGLEKDFHNWQQAEREIIPLINNFTKTNDLIVDPFAGSASFLICAKKFKRQVIGAEINQETYNIAKKRINDELF